MLELVVVGLALLEEDAAGKKAPLRPQWPVFFRSATALSIRESDNADTAQEICGSRNRNPVRPVQLWRASEHVVAL